MPIVTPRKDQGYIRSQTTNVVCSSSDPWTEEELANAAERRVWEVRFSNMPKVTTLTYRANQGAERLDVSFTDGSTFDDAFVLLAQHARTFIEWEMSEITASDSDGNIRTPSVQTAINAFQREAYRRGIVIGTQREQESNDQGLLAYKSRKTGKVEYLAKAPITQGDNRTHSIVFNDDVFRITLRPNVKSDKLPGWFKALAEKGVPQDLLPAMDEEE